MRWWRHGDIGGYHGSDLFSPVGAFGVSVASTKDARLAEQIGGTARVLTQPVS